MKDEEGEGEDASRLIAHIHIYEILEKIS